MPNQWSSPRTPLWAQTVRTSEIRPQDHRGSFTNTLLLGPWWTIRLGIDFPDESMSLLPSLANNTLLINSSACSSQSANYDCPLPVSTLFTWTGADGVANDSQTLSSEHAASEWDTKLAALLNMSGSGQTFAQVLDFSPDVNNLAVEISNSYDASFPGGASYTLDIGFVSCMETVCYW